MNSSWKQAKLPGWGVRLLSSCLWAPKDWLFFKMEQEFWTLAFVLALLRQLDFFHGRKRRLSLRWEFTILPGLSACLTVWLLLQQAADPAFRLQ